MITITDRAADKVREFMASEEDDASALRIAIEGGGCSGFQYALGFDTGPQDGDEVIEMQGVTILVDPFSLPYLKGAGIDYVEGLNGTGFQISNPNVQAACGCGSSFTAKDEDDEQGEPVATSAGGGCSGCG
jgi:iron-sulfur cluster assembly accessory protein